MAQSKADLLKEIKKLQEEINQLESKGTSLTENEVKAQEKLRNSIIRKAREIKKINQEQLDAQKNLISAIADQESGLKSLTGIYAPIKEIEKQRVKSLGESNIKSQHNVEVLGRAQAINEKIAGLTSDDIVQRQALNLELEQELNSLRGRGAALDYQKSLIMQSNALANQYAGLTEGQKEQLEAQVEVYDKIKKAIGGVLDTASLLFRGPAGFFGSVLIGAGMFEHKLAEVKMELGGISDIGTTALSFIDDNAVENAKSLASEFGSMNNVSTKLQVSTSLISTNMGISGDEAANLIGSLSRSSGSSKEMALDMIKSVQATAKLRGVMPSKALKDLAGASKEFALYSKEGAKNLQQSAIAAGELGVDLSVLTGASAALLDFETSINAELELQALTGRSINLERARQLALAEDDIGAMQEVARQLGGIAGWEAMGRWEKQQAADLLGIQVDELKKIIYNEKQVATSGSMIKETFSATGEAIDAGMNKYLGTTLEGLGGMIIATGQINGGFGAMGTSLRGVVSSTFTILKNLLGMVAGPVLKGLQSIGSSLGGSKLGQGIKSFKDRLLQGVGGGAKPQVPGADAAAGADKVSKGKGIGEQLKGLASGLKAMGNAKVLFGALNLIPTGLGFVAILPGIPGMLAVSLLGINAGVGLKSMGVGLKAMGDTKVTLGAANLALAAVGFALMTVGAIGLAAIAIGGVGAAAGLTALAGGLAAFGNPATAGFILMGIGLLALFGAAMIPLTYALSLLAPLVESIGTAIGTMILAIGQGISMIVTSLGDLMVKILPLMNLEAAAGIFAVAGAFFTLAASLGAVAVAGIAALPALAAVGLFGAVGGAIAGTIEGISGGGEEGETANESDSMSELLNEIKGLRADLNSGKVAVYMDGKKVTGTVAGVSNRVAANTYNK